METIFRPATHADLPECLEVFGEANTDMCLRHHLTPPGPVNPYRIAVHEHLLNTGILHVAQRGDCIAAFAAAIVRGRTWFLGGFWCRPEMQKQHIGMRLLRGVWEAGRQAGARVWFVWASSDFPAMSAYMKLGMLPGCQIMAFEGKSSAAAPDGYTTASLQKATVMRIDRVVLGSPREPDHDFFLRMGYQGAQVLRGAAAVGYFYTREGTVGPAAWTHPTHAHGVLALACKGQEQVDLRVPGMNHDAIRFGFAAGLRLARPSHLLMSGPFGHLERYIPSGPYLF